jgi:Protein kinase domain
VPDVLKTVGRYEILREIGRGGMAMVYLARQTDLDRFVALKELAAFHASDASFAQRFLRESRVAGSLSHPNIVTVHDYFEHDGTPYIAMEFVERGSLRPYVGRLTPEQIGGVLEGLLAGLAQAEQHGIVHRDLKPENLMVTADGRVKIADFGIAKATNQMQTGAFLTATGTTVGTPTYMAPEQAMAQEIGPWTDLYSVGCMAFELYTGRVPFHDSEAPMAILLRHVNEPIPPISTIDPSIDEAVSDWVARLLVKDPKERTQSANEAWDEYEEIVIRLLGPRWRRGARLTERAQQLDTPKPLTPAPFEGAPGESGDAAGPVSGEFQSFAWGEPVTETPPGGTGAAPAPPGPATPPPADAPAGPLEPGPIDVPTGSPTPPPLDSVAESGFVTFGAPATDTPAPGTPAADAPATDAPAGDAPAADAPAGDVPAANVPAADAPAGDAPVADAPGADARAGDAPAGAAPAADAPEDTGFLTFGAPTAPAEPAEPPPADSRAAQPGATAEPEAPAPADDAPIVGAHGDGTAEAERPAFETYVAPAPPRPPAGEPAAPPAAELEPVASAPAPPPADTARAPADAGAAPPDAGGAPPGDAGADPGLLTGEATVMPEALRRPGEAEREPRERRSLAFPIVLGIGLVVALVAGFAIGGSGGGDSGGGGAGEPAAATPSRPVSAAGVGVKVPSNYRELGSVPGVPGLALADGAAYAPGGTDGGRAVAIGMADARDSTLLPQDFRAALGLDAGQVPERTAVALGPDEIQAYRYAGLKPDGIDRRVTLYVAPTTEGVATVACLAPPAQAAAFGPECEAIADTLTLDSAKPFPVGPDPGYAKALSASFGALDRKVARGRAALARKGTTYRAQSAAAGRIADAYAGAADKLRGTRTSPADVLINKAITQRLDAAGRAWKRAEAAAKRKDKRAFAKAGGAIKQAQQGIAATLAGLKAAGYKVES